MSDNLPFDRPSRALLNSHSFTDIYFDNCTEITDDNYWTLLEIDIPYADRFIRHRFTRSTSQLISSRLSHSVDEDFSKFLCQKSWYVELYHRLSCFGLDDAKIFRRALHSLKCNKNNFLNSLSLSLPRFHFDWVLVRRATIAPFRA